MSGCDQANEDRIHSYWIPYAFMGLIGICVVFNMDIRYYQIYDEAKVLIIFFLPCSLLTFIPAENRVKNNHSGNTD